MLEVIEVAKVGVCCACQQQDIPLRPVAPEILGAWVREGGFDNVDEMEEACGESLVIASHDGPHGQPCEGIGTVPQAVYDA